MKYFTIVFVIMVILLGFRNITSKNEQSNTETTQTLNPDATGLIGAEKFYQCEMGPEIIYDKPGIVHNVEWYLQKALNNKNKW